MTSAPMERELAAASSSGAPHGNHPHHVAMYRRIATAFILLTLLVVGLVAYVVLARADVVVLSEEEPAEADFLLDVAEKPGGGEIPGVVLSMTDHADQSFPSASIVKVDAHAEGRVAISSTLGRAQTLIATTRLLTADGILFRIKKDVVVPSGGTAEVDVFADLAGSGGDVGNVATFTIPGLNADSQRFFKVRTVTPIVGGTRDVRMITKKDIDAAGETMRAKLADSLTATMREKAAEEGVAIDGEFITVDLVSQKSDVAVGSEKESFSLRIEVKAVGVFYDRARYEADLKERLGNKLPAGRNLRAIDRDATTVELEKVDVPAGRANLRVTAKATTVLAADNPELSPEKIVGISTDAAVQYLQQVEGVSSASVKVSPFWVKRLPNVPENIHIEVR